MFPTDPVAKSVECTTMLTSWVLGAPGYHKCSALVNLYSKKKICHEKLVFLPMTDDPLFANI